MKAKLVKTGNEYLLRDSGGESLAITNGSVRYRKLSRENCQAIELGYDLDELAYDCSVEWHGEKMDSAMEIYKLGFQKALELIGDKKFSEENLDKAFELGKYVENEDCTRNYLGYKQSLQQPEWLVDIEMEYYRNGNFAEDGKTHPVTLAWRPKVDEDGFIILKRI